MLSQEEIFLNFDSEVAANLVNSHLYLATTLSYSFNLFLDGALLYIESFNTKNSRFISPTLSYTLNDYNKFTLGAMVQHGEDDSEFGAYGNTYYFNWKLEF